MSLTVLTSRIILASLVLCLAARLATAQLAPLAEKKTGGSTVRGVVVYADTGRPLRFAGISLIADVGGDEYEGASDKRGQFELAHVPAGRYVLILHAPGVLKPERYTPGDYLVFTWAAGGQPYQSLEAFVQSQAPNAKRISLQSGEEKRMELTVVKPKR